MPATDDDQIRCCAITLLDQSYPPPLPLPSRVEYSQNHCDVILIIVQLILLIVRLFNDEMQHNFHNSIMLYHIAVFIKQLSSNCDLNFS